jgi:putative photosynthetic complex assembly protein 2
MGLAATLSGLWAALPPQAGAALLVLFLWWFSTGAILHAVRQPAGRHGPLLAVTSGLAALAVVWLWSLRGDATPGGAVAGFVAALVLWGWNEVLFLTGRVLGPLRAPCPAGLGLGARFAAATRAIIHHEVLVFATLLLVLALSLAQANQEQTNHVALATFALLWVLRLSAKINIFFGVPNPAEDMLPRHLAYLASYFGRRVVTPLLPVTLVVQTLGLLVLVQAALAADASPHEAVALALLAMLLALGLLEHWLLLLPVPVSALWSWKITLGKLPALDLPASAPPGWTVPAGGPAVAEHPAGGPAGAAALVVTESIKGRESRTRHVGR